MATTTNDTTWKTQAICRDEAALFSNPALDYDPADEDYADLTPAEHKTMALRKAAAERAAVNRCYECPVMQQCDAWAMKVQVAGVAGGRTESERRPMLITNGVIADETPTVVLSTDRGARGQVNDEAVHRMTTAGMSAQDIARELGCSLRTVTRARDRAARALAAA